MSVYVTVGSTGFDDLVRAVSSKEFLRSLASRGFRRLTVQYGSSEQAFSPPQTQTDTFGVAIESFDYTSTPLRFVDQADLVICHAGTGSILEALHSRKPAIVVVNRRLMDNHQSEIATALAREGYLVASEPDELASAVAEGQFTKLRPYPRADPQPIGEILDEETLLPQ
ncbi:N-acetylglucosaminyldiphosphodolichol N-acetylglucosaminyltransferase Alg13 [Martensiomyces pterosporus]|nr:N-acetylglucosaminyldiphosphodolichol N-acetylglucosaminyltransferase Alg13 [Martensiomyces pterosporus]